MRRWPGFRWAIQGVVGVRQRVVGGQIKGQSGDQMGDLLGWQGSGQGSDEGRLGQPGEMGVVRDPYLVPHSLSVYPIPYLVPHALSTLSPIFGTLSPMCYPIPYLVPCPYVLLHSLSHTCPIYPVSHPLYPILYPLSGTPFSLSGIPSPTCDPISDRGTHLRELDFFIIIFMLVLEYSIIISVSHDSLLKELPMYVAAGTVNNSDTSHFFLVL